MRAVVTGGAGFIGSNLVDALISRGDEVLVVDDLSKGTRENLAGALEAGATLLVADVADAASFADQVSGFAPDAIFHLAAQADVRRAVADPVFDARVNLLGTINALESARSIGASFVFAATGGAVYGEGEGKQLPFGEECPPAPESPYGVSKLAAEEYLAMYRRLHGVAALALRLGNVYGPRQDPYGEAGVVAILCGKLIAGDEPIVFGDGLQTRDYVYVDDVVMAMLVAARALAERGTDVAGPLNIGTGVQASVIDLVEELARIEGAEFVPQFESARIGEVQRVALDPALARKEIGWSPAVGLEQGLAVTLESVRARS